MSGTSEQQVGSLRPLFWMHVSTDNNGQPSILYSHAPGLFSPTSQSYDANPLTTDTTEDRSSRRPSSSISSAASEESPESSFSSPESEEIERPIRVKIRPMPRKRKPALRRCWSPTMESLREIRQRQSEEDLRHVYESQTLAYLNDMIHF